MKRGWRDSSELTALFVLTEEIGEMIPSSQGSSQSSLPSVPEDPTPSSGLHEQYMHVVYTYTHEGKTLIDRKTKDKSKI